MKKTAKKKITKVPNSLKEVMLKLMMKEAGMLLRRQSVETTYEVSP